MASGNRNVVFNTQERIISPDQNRHQRFRDAEVAEVLRSLLDTSFSTDDLDAGAMEVENVSLGTPVVAEVLQGLRVVPQVGQASLFVTDGVAMFLNPDGAPEDSNFKYVSDPGIQVLGSLVIAANAAGSTRIDVVEAQWTTAVTETDSRDVFQVTTGTFASQLVNKVTQGALTYRVRTGVAGGGFPGAAAGWLPLAVAVVPNGTTTTDTVTFWDVRPMVNDRALGISKVGSDRAMETFAQLVADNRNYTGVGAVAIPLSGEVVAQLDGRRVGGRVRQGTPNTTTDPDSVDLGNAANQDPTIVLTANNPYYVYLCTPLGLPRWARYTIASSGARNPRSPRGIVVASTIPPFANGRPSAAITMPTSMGMGALTTTDAVCVAMGIIGTNSSLAGFACGDGACYPFLPRQVSGAQPGPAGTDFYSLGSGFDYPASAKRILVGFSWVYAAAQTPENVATLNLWGNDVPTTAAPDAHMNILVSMAHTNLGAFAQVVWLPVPTAYPVQQLPQDGIAHGFTVSIARTNAVASVTPTMSIYAWEL